MRALCAASKDCPIQPDQENLAFSKITCGWNAFLEIGVSSHFLPIIVSHGHPPKISQSRIKCFAAQQSSTMNHFVIYDPQKYLSSQPEVCRLAKLYLNAARYALTRISHRLSTAAVHPGMSTTLRSVGFLDVLSSTPAESSLRAPCIHARLRRLAAKPGEKCGLKTKRHETYETQDWYSVCSVAFLRSAFGALIAAGFLAFFP